MDRFWKKLAKQILIHKSGVKRVLKQMSPKKRETGCIWPKNQKSNDFSPGVRNVCETTKLCEFLPQNHHKTGEKEVLWSLKPKKLCIFLVHDQLWLQERKNDNSKSRFSISKLFSPWRHTQTHTHRGNNALAHMSPNQVILNDLPTACKPCGSLVWTPEENLFKTFQI